MPLAKAIRRLLCVPALAALGGCLDPTARVDYIDPTAGDAIAANKAMQIVEPWPRRSFDPGLPGDGQRASKAIESYQSGTSGGGAAAPAK